MQAFREIVQGWLGKSLLALIGLLFVFTGYETYISGRGGEVVAASVDGEKISQALLDKAVDNQRQQLVARMGPDAVLSTEQQAQLRARVLDSLIQRELLLASAKSSGYRVSDASIQQQIQSVPTFQENGKFSPQRYAQVLAQIGETPRTFPERAREEIITAQRVTGWMQSAFVTGPELDQLSALDSQQRDASFVLVPAARFLPSVAVSDAEIKTYYDQEQKRFQQPERVSVSYITLSRSSFLNQVQVTPEAVQARYDEHVKTMAGDEQRQAAHILITVDGKVTDAEAKTKIEALAKQVADGADFAALAKANSQDPGSAMNGGALDLAGRGTYVPEFENALYALAKPGDVSPVVKSPFGYHLIKLLAIHKPNVPTLASLRPQLEKEVRETQADELFNQAVEKLDGSVYESADLQEPARQAGLSVQTTALFDHKGGEGIASQRKVIEAAFSDDLIKDGKNSGAIALADGSSIWLHVAKHEPARKQPLAEVSAQIKAQLQQDKAVALALAEAQKLADAAKTGSLAQAAASAGLSVQHQTAVGRNTQIQPQLLRDIFRAPYPVAGKAQPAAFKLDDAAAVVAVEAVRPGVALQGSQRVVTQAMVTENRARQDLQDALGYLRSKADVEISGSDASN
ncbi:MAG: SurA N-terminal domain-containing protein [Perlucidibaca sp.]